MRGTVKSLVSYAPCGAQSSMSKSFVKPFIGYITIRLLAHATEDEDRVLEAARNLFPSARAGEVRFKRVKLRGHHGNPIVVFEAKVRKTELIEGMIQRLSSNLRPEDKEMLARKVDLHIDGSNLYLRLDKQAALRGELRLENVDPIRICIHFKRRWASRIPEACKSLGIIP